MSTSLVQVFNDPIEVLKTRFYISLSKNHASQNRLLAGITKYIPAFYPSGHVTAGDMFKIAPDDLHWKLRPAFPVFTPSLVIVKTGALTAMDGGNADFAGAKICQPLCHPSG